MVVWGKLIRQIGTPFAITTVITPIQVISFLSLNQQLVMGTPPVSYTTWQTILQDAVETNEDSSITSDPAFVNAGGSYALDTGF